MAPATSLHLLHIAAVLVMMASSGGVLAAMLFPSDVLDPTFKVLGDRKCLPDDFDTSAITKAGECAAKVKSGDVPAECAGAPLLAQFYNCYANSMGDMVIVDGKKSFQTSNCLNRMKSFTADEEWQWFLEHWVQACHELAPAGLSADQKAAQHYMCMKFGLFVDCDHHQYRNSSLDAAAIHRREHFVAHSLEMMVAALGQSAMWAACSQNMVLADLHAPHHEGVNVEQHYDQVLSATECFLDELFPGDDGFLDAGLFFEQLLPAIPPNLRILEYLCGPKSEAYENITAGEFIQCIIAEGTLLEAVHDANQAVVLMSCSCVISV